jgi:polysaccharide biosynthesis/export protein
VRLTELQVKGKPNGRPAQRSGRKVAMKVVPARTLSIAAALLMQQLIVVSALQAQTPDMANRRVPGAHGVECAVGMPATMSLERAWDCSGKPGTETTQSGGADGTGKPALGGERRPLYRLQRSDVIEVHFTFSPEFDETVTVQPDGYVRPQNVGNIYAIGKTLPEMEAAIRAAYVGRLHDPEINLVLKEFDKPFFIAGGEVGHPGKYELRSETTVIEALQMAGGITHEGRHSEVLLFRRISDDLTEARVLNVKKMLSQGALAEDPRLRPGDFVFVPQNTISKISRYLPTTSLGMYLNNAQF